MYASGLSSQSCTVYLGQDPHFCPLMGSVWGAMGPRRSAKASAGGRGGVGGVEEVRIWRLGGSRGGGGCSGPPGEACGARAEDAALGKSMLILLSLLQSRYGPGRLRVMGRSQRGCRGM